MREGRANRIFLILTLTSILLAPNCATLTRSSKQRIPVTSSPVGAAVFVNGVLQGVTPLEIRLARKEKGQVIRIESPGCNPVEIRPKRTVSGFYYFFPDLVLGIFCALPIIFASSVDHELDPGIGTAGVAILSTAAFTGLFIAIDLVTKKAYDFEPTELIVTLKKTDGKPRVDTRIVDADRLSDIKWIRVRSD